MQRRSVLISIPLIALSLLAATDALATEDGVEMLGSGEIRWNDQVIRATGSGAPNADAPNVAVARITAERTAEMDARRNILETLKGVRIDGKTTMGTRMESNDIITGKVAGVVRGARVVDKKYFSDGGVEVTVEMSIDAKSLGSVLPMDKAGARRDEMPKEGKLYTGLAIDARGLGFEPSLSPQIVDPNGEVLYDVTFVDPNALAKNGLVEYVKSNAEFKKSKRKGDQPLLIKAVSGEASRLYLSADGAAKIAGSDQRYLQKGNVILWID